MTVASNTVATNQSSVSYGVPFRSWSTAKSDSMFTRLSSHSFNTHQL